VLEDCTCSNLDQISCSDHDGEQENDERAVTVATTTIQPLSALSPAPAARHSVSARQRSVSAPARLLGQTGGFTSFSFWPHENASKQLSITPSQQQQQLNGEEWREHDGKDEAFVKRFHDSLSVERAYGGHQHGQQCSHSTVNNRYPSVLVTATILPFIPSRNDQSPQHTHRVWHHGVRLVQIEFIRAPSPRSLPRPRFDILNDNSSDRMSKPAKAHEASCSLAFVPVRDLLHLLIRHQKARPPTSREIRKTSILKDVKCFRLDQLRSGVWNNSGKFVASTCAASMPSITLTHHSTSSLTLQTELLSIGQVINLLKLRKTDQLLRTLRAQDAELEQFIRIQIVHQLMLRNHGPPPPLPLSFMQSIRLLPPSIGTSSIPPRPCVVSSATTATTRYSTLWLEDMVAVTAECDEKRSEDSEDSIGEEYEPDANSEVWKIHYVIARKVIKGVEWFKGPLHFAWPTSLDVETMVGERETMD